MKKDLSDIYSGFSKLERADRLKRLLQAGVLTREDIEFLREGGKVDIGIAEHFIENVIGFFQMPMGVATNFRIDEEDYMIPMAVEETSIIAAASKTAKWIREKGKITTRSLGQEIIGQVQMARVKDPVRVRQVLEANADRILALSNRIAAGLVRRGGGVTRLEVREVPRHENNPEEMMSVLHLYCNPCDAMGANIINQVTEGVKPLVEDLTGERVTMCILSNLVDTKLTEVKVEFEQLEPDLAEGIEEASLFAQQDPYRAATNNKGILNGVDAVLLATGNDWRAVEAGMHAYAARSGQYRSLSQWKREGKGLVGQMVAPIVVGTVGGVTALHPMAKLAMKMMNIRSAEHLGRIIGAVGLVQNLGALRALSTVGVVEGHMKLHAANLAMAAGAQQDELASVREKLEELLRINRRVSLSQAVEVLSGLRKARVTAEVDRAY